jgi:DNA-binding winged helix-turn-helix (wHTH) protein
MENRVDEFPPSARSVRFGLFEADLRAGEIRKRGLRIKLQSQPFQLLVILLKQQGELVTREELRSTLWPEGTFIDFDHSLGTAINKLREVLGDSATNPRFIETLPRRGYRFIAPVEIVRVDKEAPKVSEAPPVEPELPVESALDLKPAASADLPVVTEAGSRNHGRIWKLSGIALILIVVAAIGTWKLRSGVGPAPTIQSLAVLPLENLSGDPAQDYFSDGMTDELITELGQISNLRVISRSSVMTYKTARKPLPEIARVKRRRRCGRHSLARRRPGSDHGAVDRSLHRPAFMGPKL